MDTILTAVVMGGIGAAIGAAFGPALADLLLKKMLDKLNDWYDRSMDAWEKWCAKHPGQKPQAGAPGEEGALGVWADDCLRAIGCGELDPERTARAKAIGVDESCYIDQKAEVRAKAVQNVMGFAGATVKASVASMKPGFAKPRKVSDDELAQERETLDGAQEGGALDSNPQREDAEGEALGSDGHQAPGKRADGSEEQAADEGGADER